MHFLLTYRLLLYHAWDRFKLSSLVNQPPSLFGLINSIYAQFARRLLSPGLELEESIHIWPGVELRTFAFIFHLPTRQQTNTSQRRIRYTMGVIWLWTFQYYLPTNDRLHFSGNEQIPMLATEIVFHDKNTIFTALKKHDVYWNFTYIVKGVICPTFVGT